LLFVESFLVFFRSLHVWDAFEDYGAFWSKTDNLSCGSNPETKIDVGVDRHNPRCRATPIPDDKWIAQLIDVLKISKFGPELSPIFKEVLARFRSYIYIYIYIYSFKGHCLDLTLIIFFILGSKTLWRLPLEKILLNSFLFFIPSLISYSIMFCSSMIML